MEKLPLHIRKMNDPFFEFNKTIIDATHDLVIAYKPNTAFYEALGTIGLHQLKLTCDYIKHTYPEVLIILDAKRADIGNTNQGYVTFAFDLLDADMITLHPYLGKEAMLPFLQRKDKGSIFLCKTSNTGSNEFQSLEVGNRPLYQHIAQEISEKWNENKNCLLVVGATYPNELKKVRELVGDMPILVPGIGAQGGDLQNTLDAGLTINHNGLIISSSREIIYAGNDSNFAEESRKKTEMLWTEMNTSSIPLH